MAAGWGFNLAGYCSIAGRWGWIKKTPSLQMELEQGSLPPTQDIFWGKFMNYDATRIRKIYDFPRGKCFLRTGDKNFLAYTV